MYGTGGLTSLPMTGAVGTGAALSINVTLGLIVGLLTLLFAVLAVGKMLPAKARGL